MEDHLIDSDLSSTTTTLRNAGAELSDKAWYFLSLLLKIGHPVSSIDLASRCISFQSSPEFVEFLCSIPNSPLFLTSDHFVTLSAVVLVAFHQFLINTNVITGFVHPRLSVGDFLPKRVWGTMERTYSRKRMKLRSDVLDELPAPKKRAVLRNVEEKDCYLVLGLPASLQVPLHVKDAMKRSMVMCSDELSVMKSDKPDEETTTSLCLNFSAGFSSYNMNNNEAKSEWKADTSAPQKELGCISKPDLQYNFQKYERFPHLPDLILERVKACMPYQEPIFLTRNPVVRREEMLRNIYFLSLSSSSASCQEVGKHKMISSAEAENTIYSHKPPHPDPRNDELFMEGREEEIPNSSSQKDNAEDLQINTVNIGMAKNALRCIDMLPSLGERSVSCKVGEHNLISPVEAVICANQDENVPEDERMIDVRDEPLINSGKGEGGMIAMPDTTPGVDVPCANQDQNVPEDERPIDGRDEPLINSGNAGGGMIMMPDITPGVDVPCGDDFRSRTALRYINTPSYLDQEETAANLASPVSVDMVFLNQKPLTESHVKSKIVSMDASTLKPKTILKVAESKNMEGAHVEPQQCKIDKRSISTKQKLKNDEPKKHMIEKRENSVENKEMPCSMKNQLEPKALPNFDSFIVEEEEGSGGYGTVYKAKRKKDGATFAIKYPHGNANRYHVQNELKMLERFGGKNFVIKYEGSFKSGSSECIVLEHFEHDRPEALKKEIDIFQLQWYGFCLFRALASLHKQGVVHRDVKPGNFLFSRKANKGYLIDFNLALDVHQKYGSIEKSKVHHDSSLGHVPLPRTESLLPTKSRKRPCSKAFEADNQEAGNRSKSLLFLKNLKKKPDQTKGHTDLSKKGLLRSQGADGSGVTSAKDATSTRVTSAERLREPIPCQGRKELISLAQEAMQSPNHDFVSAPASKRKRIAAPPGKVDKDFVYLTPMPLHSTGIAVAGAGLYKNKGEGKQRKEGPCVGTKGFRAPEILFRSTYQGPKVDVWSAGVTLLYLITGRAPFGGEPDQNIKEIAKLRGSEDLWEVAKLHNRESSFPADLFDIKSLPSTKLREWCKQNTRRPDFHELTPRSLFDLVDKCLTVNPRVRISAEDALRHEFFAPCLERLKKQRLLRQGCSLDSGTADMLDTQPQTCEGLLL